MMTPPLVRTLMCSALLLACDAPPDDAADAAAACVTPLSAECQPLYSPTFEAVHANTFIKKCALAGGACHAATGAQGGLVLEDPDGAWGALHDGRIIPGEPGCGELVSRLESTDPARMMPPGQPLSEAERCAIQQWIAAGAER